jgi:nucleotide-binding universal stress UspA family protein
MNHMTDHIIFATNFSDACHAAIPTVTRWVDAHKARLTILHVYDPAKTLHRDAQAQLNAFYAEADNYSNCTRVLLAGDPCDSIENFCAREGDGLLFMPPSDRSGLPRPFHVSTRARLLEHLEMPVWTMGKATMNTSAAVAGKNIAVCVQNLDHPTGYVLAAASHAQRHGATLHLMHVVPETTEGTLITALHSNAPLGVETAIDMLSDLAATLPAAVKVQVHVRMGSQWRELKHMLRESGAELLMVGSEQTLHRSFFRPTINPMLNHCEIPIICLPEGIGVRSSRAQARRLVAA